jgi:hypothetical protein
MIKKQRMVLKQFCSESNSEHTSTLLVVVLGREGNIFRRELSKKQCVLEDPEFSFTGSRITLMR